MITIAMPVWNSKDIAWLAMESFCRQQCDMPWELLIIEEKHAEECSEEFYNIYADRLYKSGCIDFKLFKPRDKLALSEKWRRLGVFAAHKKSKMFCVCDADNYYHPFMLHDAYKAYIEDYDFLTDKEGYAYDFVNKLLVRYKKPESNTGFTMCYRTDLLRNMPRTKQHKLLNTWVFKNAKPKKIKINKEHTTSMITNGYNNITGARGEMMRKFQHPFYKTDKQLEDFLPIDIVKRIKEM